MPYTDVVANRFGSPAAALCYVFNRFRARVWLALATGAKAWTVRRAERILMEMPDYLLKDIGIGRGEIRRAVRQGWAEEGTD
jgi:uncharacterized protein YjiS (DUF1127 family)